MSLALEIRCNQMTDGRPCKVVISGDTPTDRLAKMGSHVAAVHGKAPRDAMAEAAKVERTLADVIDGDLAPGVLRCPEHPSVTFATDLSYRMVDHVEDVHDVTREQAQTYVATLERGGTLEISDASKRRIVAKGSGLSDGGVRRREHTGGETVTTKASTARSRPGRERCAECGRKASSVPMSPSQHRRDCSQHVGAKGNREPRPRDMRTAGARKIFKAGRIVVPQFDRVVGTVDVAAGIRARLAEIARHREAIAKIEAELDAIRALLARKGRKADG